MHLGGAGQAVVAQPAAGQHGEREEPLGVPVVADAQPPTPGQPGDRPLRLPPVAAQPIRRLHPAPGDADLDPPARQVAAAAAVVVVGSGRSAVPCSRSGPFLRPAPPNPPCALPRNGLSTSPRQWAPIVWLPARGRPPEAAARRAGLEVEKRFLTGVVKAALVRRLTTGSSDRGSSAQWRCGQPVETRPGPSGSIRLCRICPAQQGWRRTCHPG